MGKDGLYNLDFLHFMWWKIQRLSINLDPMNFCYKLKWSFHFIYQSLDFTSRANLGIRNTIALWKDEKTDWLYSAVGGGTSVLVEWVGSGTSVGGGMSERGGISLGGGVARSLLG